MPIKRKKKKKKTKKDLNRISMRAADHAWQKLIDDDSGDPYWYNTVTQVCLATIPLGSTNTQKQTLFNRTGIDLG